jgi:hypothetical protein
LMFKLSLIGYPSIKMEILYTFDGVPGFTLGQGQ